MRVHPNHQFKKRIFINHPAIEVTSHDFGWNSYGSIADSDKNSIKKKADWNIYHLPALEWCELQLIKLIAADWNKKLINIPTPGNSSTFFILPLGISSSRWNSSHHPISFRRKTIAKNTPMAFDSGLDHGLCLARPSESKMWWVSPCSSMGWSTGTTNGTTGLGFQ